jgi:hypothetical protein
MKSHSRGMTYSHINLLFFRMGAESRGADSGAFIITLFLSEKLRHPEASTHSELS